MALLGPYVRFAYSYVILLTLLIACHLAEYRFPEMDDYEWDEIERISYSMCRYSDDPVSHISDGLSFDVVFRGT